MTGTESAPFGERLRQLREAAGLTQEELAARAGLTANGVASLERGRRQRPYPHTIAALAAALGLVGEERAAFVGATARRAATTPATAPAPPLATLPAPPLPLVGRERGLAEVGTLLRDTGQLVTLTGPGGVGKTRLALAVAQQRSAQCRDGAAFVPLAALTEPALVLPAIAEALGLREMGHRPVTEVLRDALRAWQLLLVLDNCEHLLDAAPAIGALLSTAPGLTILATSRAPLRLRGEREYPVAPLAIPELTHLPTVAALAGNPAVHLFVARAQAVSPSFALTQADAAAIAAICRRLDGLPLALELAAVRIRLLRPTELLRRLDRVLPLLGGGARDLPARQRTMRDTIAWSHDLLGAEERALFRRLAVFAGGWDLAAAEALGGDDRGGAEVMGLLATLVEQSLVLAQRTPSGESRYRFLEPVREYARERLEESGEAGRIGERHARCYLARAEALAPSLTTSDRAASVARLERDHDNLRAALTWARAATPADRAAGMVWLRLVAALWWFWLHANGWTEGRQWLAGALASVAPQPGNEAEGRAWAEAAAGAGFLAWTQGDQEAARDYLERSVAHWRQLNAPPIPAGGLGMTLNFLALALLGTGDLDAARALSDESVAIFRAAPDPFGLASVLASRGILALTAGDLATAAPLLDESVAIHRAAGDTWGLSLPLRSRGLLALRQGDDDRAVAVLRESLAILRDMGEVWFLTRGLDLLAAALALRGDLRQAAGPEEAGEALRALTGATILPYHQGYYDAGVLAVRAGLGEADLAAAWAAGQALTPDEALTAALAESLA